MYRKLFCFCTISFLIIMALVSIAVGSNDPGNEIIGVWKFKKIVTDGKQNLPMTEDVMGGTIEFFSDKTFLFKYKRGGANGPWVVLNDGRIKMTTETGTVHLGSIKGNELIIKSGSYGGDERWYLQK